MRPRLMTRSPGTRTTRCDARQRRMESLAAEFALLAQRRARLVHQIDLLDQQRDAAALGFSKLQARMAWLVQRMDMLDPELREGFAPPPEPAPPPPPPPPPARPIFVPTSKKVGAKSGPMAGRNGLVPGRAGLNFRPNGGKWRT